MTQSTDTRLQTAGKVLAFTVVALLALSYWQINKGFSLWDEGYLWYGSQRVMLGEVPIRDFMAYDPGRYYWTAAWMTIFGGNGIIEMRTAVTLFQAPGLFVGLFLIARSTGSLGKFEHLFWLIATATLLTWMLPRHKLFDISISIFLVGILAYLIENPAPKRYFAVGFCIGLIAVFGRNHGIYGVVGSLGVIGWLRIKQPTESHFFKNFALWVIGISTGFIPIILMMIMVPGFSMSFWESIRMLFEKKMTNLPLPVPWPWTVEVSGLAFDEVIRRLLTGFFFIGMLTFGALGVFWVVLQKFANKPVSPSLVACTFMAIPYAHYSFSRADVGHLALGIFPFIIGCFIILSTKGWKLKWTFSIALFVASIWTTFVFHAGWQCRTEKHCVKVMISENNLLIDPATAHDVTLLRELTEKYSTNGRAILAVPFWPGAYALLERKSPIWEIYAVWDRSNLFQEMEIERINAAKPGFILVLDIPLDDRDDLRFKNTHAKIQRFIEDNYDQHLNSPSSAYQIYIAR